MENENIIWDFELKEKNTNETIFLGELVPVDNTPVNREYKPVRKVIVAYEMLNKIKIGDKVKIEIVISGNDLSIEGNIIAIDDCIVSIQ